MVNSLSRKDEISQTRSQGLPNIQNGGKRQRPLGHFFTCILFSSLLHFFQDQIWLPCVYHIWKSVVKTRIMCVTWPNTPRFRRILQRLPGSSSMSSILNVSQRPREWGCRFLFFQSGRRSALLFSGVLVVEWFDPERIFNWSFVWLRTFNEWEKGSISLGFTAKFLRIKIFGKKMEIGITCLLATVQVIERYQVVVILKVSQSSLFSKIMIRDTL